MATSKRLTVSVPQEVADEMRRAVETGEYESMDAIVDQALRDWNSAKLAEASDVDLFRQAVERSDASGPGVPAEQVYAYLRARIARRRAA